METTTKLQKIVAKSMYQVINHYTALIEDEAIEIDNNKRLLSKSFLMKGPTLIREIAIAEYVVSDLIKIREAYVTLTDEYMEPSEGSSFNLLSSGLLSMGKRNPFETNIVEAEVTITEELFKAHCMAHLDALHNHYTSKQLDWDSSKGISTNPQATMFSQYEQQSWLRMIKLTKELQQHITYLLKHE